MLASVVEAIIGACYLECGFEETAAAVVEAFGPEIDAALEHPVDFKSPLQERLARDAGGRELRGGGGGGPAPRPDLRGHGHGRGGSRCQRDAGARRRTPSRRRARAALRRHWRRSERPVHLKAVNLKGFKSFPDRLTLEFGPGVSVIVGPNGSGQVEHHRRRAVGDGRAVAGRGARAVDAGRDLRRRPRAAGAPGRRGRDRHRQGRRRRSSSPLYEISIVRRLDRSGDGEYRLNGATLPPRRRHRGARGHRPRQGDRTRSSRRGASRRSSRPSPRTAGC